MALGGDDILCTNEVGEETNPAFSLSILSL